MTLKAVEVLFDAHVWVDVDDMEGVSLKFYLPWQLS